MVQEILKIRMDGMRNLGIIYTIEGERLLKNTKKRKDSDGL